MFEMKYENYFKDIFESIPEYRKSVLLIFIFRNEKKLLIEIGFSGYDINRSNSECTKIIIEQHEIYLDYIKNEEESIVERFLNK